MGSKPLASGLGVVKGSGACVQPDCPFVLHKAAVSATDSLLVPGVAMEILLEFGCLLTNILACCCRCLWRGVPRAPQNLPARI